MELKVEDVKNIQSITVCKKFLRQSIVQNDKLNQELRHQKYKRCRGMMMWCASRAVTLSQYGNEKDSDWFWKWKDKWKKLAEQFKEDK